MQVTIKFVLKRSAGDEVHRFRSDAATTFDAVLEMVRQWWPSPDPLCQTYVLQYTDGDGDVVTMGSEPEWRECIAVLGQGVVRVTVSKRGKGGKKEFKAMAADIEDVTSSLKEEVTFEETQKMLDDSDARVVAPPSKSRKTRALWRKSMKAVLQAKRCAEKQAKKKIVIDSVGDAIKGFFGFLGKIAAPRTVPATTDAAPVAPEMATLLAVFPGLDEATATLVLRAARGNVRKAIESLLQ